MLWHKVQGAGGVGAKKAGPEFVSYNAVRGTNTWSISGTSPTDLLVMAWQRPTNAQTGPNNLTLIQGDTSTEFAAGVSWGVNVTSGTFSGASDAKYVVAAFSNADTSLAPTVSVGEGIGASATVPSLGGFNVGSDIVLIGCVTDIRSNPAYSGSGYTLLPPTSNGNIQMAYKVSTSSTESPSPFTMSSDEWFTFIAKISAP